MSDEPFEITIVVDGQAVEVKVGQDEQIAEAVEAAVKVSGNSDKLAAGWELRDESGRLVDTDKTVGQAGIVAGSKLLLSLKAGDERFEITIVVNGQPFEVKVALDEQIAEAVEQALRVSGNSGQPAERWELRDESGQPIDTGEKIGQAGISAGAKLFLSLKAGVGGGGV